MKVESGIKLGTTIQYVVEFVIYKFNMGLGNNGNIRVQEEFPTLGQAKEFREKILVLLDGTLNNGHGYQDLCEDYVEAGCVVQFLGMYKKVLIYTSLE